MEHISHRVATIQDKTTSPDILVISRTFLPKEGGIEEYIYNRCLQDPQRVVVLTAGCAGDKAFDQVQRFPIHRFSIPKSWRSGLQGIILTPLLNTIWSFLLAIKLYFRYHYRYIEWSYGCNFLSLLLLNCLLPIRFFIYLHGNEILRAVRNPVARSLFGSTLKRAAGVVCNNSFTRDYLSAHFQFNTPTHVINPVVRREKFGIRNPCSVEDLRLRVRNSYNIPDSAVVILSVGKLNKNQGFDLIIDHLPLLLTLGMNVHYLLCGEGPFESQLQSQVRRLRLDRWVHFTGYVAANELAGYYAACDIFAMLSLFDTKAAYMEDNGIVYLEAGYFGKPVIASCIGSAIDAVRPGENGLLVNTNSGYEMFTAFRRLCQDKQLREQLGRRGRVLANKRNLLHRRLYIQESRYSCLLT